MVKEIRLYIEGAGESSLVRIKFRNAFNKFLASVKEKAREKGINIQPILCGSRNSAFDDFKTALKTHSNAFNILLVDSEGLIAISDPKWSYLQRRDNWNPPGVSDEHCHLMVQTMEAWFFADIEALSRYYGQGFNPSGLPKNKRVEEIEKARLEPALKTASKVTKKKEYHKTRHAPDLLELIDPEKVQAVAPHCKRLFDKLTELIDT